MARFSRNAFLLIVGLSTSLSACGKDKKASSGDDAETLVCESNDDCEEGWACLDGACANAASGAIYTDTANAVTPDKMKGQVEKIQENSQKRADEILDGL